MKSCELPSPAQMRPGERAGEITAILAAAIVRSLAGDARKQREVGLGFLTDQRVHTTPYPQEKL